MRPSVSEYLSTVCQCVLINQVKVKFTFIFSWLGMSMALVSRSYRWKRRRRVKSEVFKSFSMINEGCCYFICPYCNFWRWSHIHLPWPAVAHFWYWFCPELLLHFVGLGQSFWNAVSLLQQLLAVFPISTLHSLDKLKFCHSLCCSQMNI